MQDDLPIKSVLSHNLFPNRALLRVGEIAEAWGVDEQHIRRLIECGDLAAIDLRTSKPANLTAANHKSFRQWLRIPVAEFDRFTKSRAL